MPFRKEDERRLALLARLGDHPVTRRRFFRLHLRVGDAVGALRKTPPNGILLVAALLLDLGLPAGRAGMGLAVLMSHNFIANAIEPAGSSTAAPPLARAHARLITSPTAGADPGGSRGGSLALFLARR